MVGTKLSVYFQEVSVDQGYFEGGGNVEAALSAHLFNCHLRSVVDMEIDACKFLFEAVDDVYVSPVRWVCLCVFG